ncbi:MAG: hypothetical protein H6721_24185 [Sandaracinus sp.]|nr:hypothetical protein [Sandaracinus sp.]MCB9635230.1 hypothetical protein [Sandaracinus sp.]
MDLAQLLIEQGLDARRVDEAARRSVQRGAPFVQEIVRAGLVEEETVAELAARALGTVLVAVEHGELDEESVRLLPRRVAMRHLVVPVAKDAGGDRLRVAFADPFDAEAVEAVRRATGLEIDPLVSTVSSIQSAIDRAYRGDTKVVHRAASARETAPATPTRELPAESTQRVDRAMVADAIQTMPVHRVEDEATVEQRVEALILTLIDAGVIARTDYLEALRRLLGR